MRYPFARWLFLMLLALAIAAPANSTPPPPPPPPRPFDDPSIALRFEAWERAFVENVNDAAAKLAQARNTIRGEHGNVGMSIAAEKRAAKEFAVARRRSLKSLDQLAILYAEMKPVASAGDLQRLDENLNRWREWFSNTEPNSLEILEALTD